MTHGWSCHAAEVASSKACSRRRVLWPPLWAAVRSADLQLQRGSVPVVLSARRAAAGKVLGGSEALGCRADGTRLLATFHACRRVVDLDAPLRQILRIGALELVEQRGEPGAWVFHWSEPIACGVSLALPSFHSHAAQPIGCTVGWCRAPCSLMVCSSQPHCERRCGAEHMFHSHHWSTKPVN